MSATENRTGKPGLSGLVQHVLFEKMVAVATKNGDEFKCMVLDHLGTQIVSNACSMSEIADLGVTHVDDLNKDRQPQPQLGAIYLVEPTRSSLRRIFNDFHKKRSTRMYSEAWLFFTRTVPDHLFELLQSEIDRNDGFRSAVMLCRELNLEFLPIERSGFSLSMPEFYYQIYRQRKVSEVVGAEENYDRIVERLFHVCAALGEVPDIAYFDMEPTASPEKKNMTDWLRISQQLQTDVSKVATELHERLRQFAGTPSAPQLSAQMRGIFREKFGMKRVPRSSRDSNSLLIILDRSVDPVGPLLHDLFYEALVHDVVPLSSFGEVSFSYTNDKGDQKVKTVPFADPLDPIWNRCKHMHLADFLVDINQAWSKFQYDFAEFFPGKDGNAGSVDLRTRLERMSEFTEKHTQFSKHIHLQGKLTRALEERALQDICQLEMLMVNGRDVWDSVVDTSGLMSSLSNLLREAALCNEDKMRLLIIYYAAVGSAASDEAAASAGSRSDFQGLTSQAFPHGAPPQFASILRHLENHCFLTHLDTQVQQTGTGQKTSVTYGYGKSRRRYMTEPAGDEYNPQRSTNETTKASTPSKLGGLMDRLTGRTEEVEISGRDALCRFEPTLYWLVKDLAKGRENPYSAYWCGINADEDAAAREYTLKTPLDWLSYEKAQKQTEDRRRAGKVGTQRTIIICVLGGVTYAEIRSAAKLERRTGCKVLIGGTEVLSPRTYLERMSMEGDWTTVPEDVEPPKYNPKENVVAAAAAAASAVIAEGKSAGCVERCLDGLMGVVPAKCARALCCDDEGPISRPLGHENRGAVGSGPEALIPSNP